MTKIDDAVVAAMKIPGWMEEKELYWLADRAHEMSVHGVWLDIGVLAGRSWTCVARAMPEYAVLWALDANLSTQLSPDNYGGVWEPRWPRAWSWQDSLRQIERPTFRWMMGEGPAEDYAHLIADRSLDVVFIDACHTYEGTKAQIELYRPKLKTDGLLCGHDYSVSWPGVVQAVDELLPERWYGPGSLWYTRV